MALVRMATRMKATFGVSIPLAVLLSRPTLGGVATAVDAVRHTREEDDVLHQPRVQRAPASASVRRLWAADAIDGTDGTYNVSIALRLDGELDAAKLESGLDVVAQRHPMLRARLIEDFGELLVDIDSGSQWPKTRIDLRGLDPAQQHADLERKKDTFFSQRLPLGSGALAVAAIVALDDAVSELWLCAHHTIIDGESLQTVCSDLAAYYAGRDVPAERRSYLEYCLEDPVVDPAARRRWADLLAGTDFFTVVPTGPRGPRRSSVREFSLGRYLTDGAEAVAGQSGTSLFTFCLAAWLATLANETGDQPILAVQVSTRPIDYGSTVGAFINQIPVRRTQAGKR